MKPLKDYVVNLYSLANKKHHFEYEIKDSFFSHFENSLFTNGNYSVDVEMDKNDRMIQCLFKIKGNSEVVCDRSLEPFMFEIDKEEKIIFKYAQEYEEVSEDLIHIPDGMQQLDLAPYIFELLTIEVPMKFLHPKFQDEDSEDDEEDVFIYSSQSEEESESEETEEQSNDDQIDPRWQQLLNLKTNKK